jgi:uncharacterized protein (TIGR03083 family)
MNTTVIDVRDIRPLHHAEAMDLAATGYERLLDLLGELEGSEWGRPTDCERWTVKDVVCHVLGEAEAFASLHEFMRQFRVSARDARQTGADPLDAMNDLQVRERSSLSTAELMARLRAIAPLSVKRRRRTPRLMRGMPMKLPIVGKTSYGYLSDVIINRDVWMHRIDVARAAGKELVLTDDYDGRVVADVVADWGRRHGHPFVLVLEGPAGGSYGQSGAGEAEEHRLDAVKFCRILSGRGHGTGLLRRPALF